MARLLPYDTQQISTNDSNVGGADNSITPNGTPNFATKLWCYDFSIDGEPHWVFVHEFGHVWQSIYGTPPILGALANFITHPGAYRDSYKYDLTTSTNFLDYNIEQQASICADYWAVLNNTDTRNCTNPASPKISDYTGFMAQVQNAKAAPAPTATAQPADGQQTGTATASADPSQPADPQAGAAPASTDPSQPADAQASASADPSQPADTQTASANS